MSGALSVAGYVRQGVAVRAGQPVHGLGERAGQAVQGVGAVGVAEHGGGLAGRGGCRAVGEVADQGVRVGEHEHDVAGVPGVNADHGHLVMAAGMID